MTSQDEPDPNPSESPLLRLERNYLLVLLAIAVGGTVLMAPAQRWLGVGVIGLCLLSLAFMHLQVSVRVVGWTSVALGLVVISLPELLSRSTLSGLLASSLLDEAGRAAVVAFQFELAAGMLFALSVPIILLNRAGTHIDPKIEKAAGMIVLLVALAFAALLVVRPSAVRSGLLIFAVSTVLAGAADVAPGKWKAIAAAAALLAAVMYLAQFHPEWLGAVRADVAATWRLFADHTVPDTLWAMLFGGLVTAMGCVNARLPWRRSLAAILLVVFGIWFFLVTAAAGLSAKVRE